MSEASFEFCQGETVTCQAAIQYTGGGAYNITNHTIVWMLSAYRGGPALLTKSTTAGNLTILSGPQGSIQFIITSAESGALASQVYHHELHLKAPAPGSQEYCAWRDRAECHQSMIGVI